MNTPLNIVPAPLLRLILCGGGGLAPAYGPLTGPESGTCEPRRYVYDGVDDIALAPEDDESAHWMSRDDEWLMPLNAKSPWPARLALVAAWMVVPPMQRKYIAAANIEITPSSICLRVWLGGGEPINYEWDLQDAEGACSWSGLLVPAPSTLPQHIQTHPPVVALVLALWDIPEIRARIEAP
jgi:hypothetical protein